MILKTEPSKIKHNNLYDAINFVLFTYWTKAGTNSWEACSASFDDFKKEGGKNEKNREGVV